MSHRIPSSRPSTASSNADDVFAVKKPRSLSADPTLPHPTHPELKLAHLQTYYGKKSSHVANQYNLMASYQRRGVFFVFNSNGLFRYQGASNLEKAIEYHKEALMIFHCNRYRSISGGRYEEARELAVEMASTLSDIGNVLLELNQFVKSAFAFRECINLFLEGLVDEGPEIRQKFDEVEELFKRNQNFADEFSGSSSIFDQESCLEEFFGPAEKIVKGFNRQGIAKVLATHPAYRSAVHGILALLRKIPSATIVSIETNSDSKWRHRTVLSRRDSILSLDDTLCDSSAVGNEPSHSSSLSSLTGTLTSTTSSACSSIHGFIPSQPSKSIEKSPIYAKEGCASGHKKEASDDTSLRSVEVQTEDGCGHSLARTFEMLEMNTMFSVSASSTIFGDENITNSTTCNQTDSCHLGQLIHMGKSLRFILHCIPTIAGASSTLQI
ncbi:hypothetical protein ACHAXS_002906 [Conticribra weissflogii]